MRAIANIHDLGHMPFNHWGEQAANNLLYSYARRWNHDAVGLRVAVEWSNRALSYQGMNLTLDTLEGLSKRYWRYRPHEQLGHFNHSTSEIPASIVEIDKRFNLHLPYYNHAEGQIAAIADWIAFTGTDIEDGLRTGNMTLKDVLESFPFAQEVYEGMVADMRDFAKEQVEAFRAQRISSGSIHNVSGLKAGSDDRQAALAKQLAIGVKNRLIQDVVEQTERNIKAAQKAGRLKHAEDVRDLDDLIVGFSPETLKAVESFGKYCVEKVFPHALDKHGNLVKMAELVVMDIVNDRITLPKDWEALQRNILGFEEGEKQPPFARMSRQQQGDMIELACAYMTCSMGDTHVKDYVRQNHKSFWREHMRSEGQARANQTMPSRIAAIIRSPRRRHEPAVSPTALEVPLVQHYARRNGGESNRVQNFTARIKQITGREGRVTAERG